jgi:nucleotidyltransferase substrate binding protein (TIGR01987 family)
MTNDPLDMGPLERALHRLQEGWDRYRQDVSDLQIRDGLLRRFEFTYEISHKMLKRYLESISADPQRYDGMPFQDLIRSGNEHGLLRGDWEDWKRYRHMRAQTSHAYDEPSAQEVVAEIPRFLEEIRFLCAQLRSRLS